MLLPSARVAAAGRKITGPPIELTARCKHTGSAAASPFINSQPRFPHQRTQQDNVP